MVRHKSRRTERDTYNYTLYGLGGEVYHGITNDPDRRIREHERDGKFFMSYDVSAARSRSRAESEETRAIHNHQDRSFGMAPQYNKAKVKKNQWGFDNLF